MFKFEYNAYFIFELLHQENFTKIRSNLDRVAPPRPAGPTDGSGVPTFLGLFFSFRLTSITEITEISKVRTIIDMFVCFLTGG